MNVEEQFSFKFENFNLDIELAICSLIISYPTTREMIQSILRDVLYEIIVYLSYNPNDFDSLIGLYVEDSLSCEQSIEIFKNALNELNLILPDPVRASIAIINHYSEGVVNHGWDPIEVSCILTTRVPGSMVNVFYALKVDSDEETILSAYAYWGDILGAELEETYNLFNEHGGFSKDALEYYGINGCENLIIKTGESLFQKFVEIKNQNESNYILRSLQRSRE